MCTAVSLLCGDHYFGRNLDLEYTYEEAVVITPRCFPIQFRNGQVLDNHHAIIGIGTVIDGYPLYYDCTNERGLSVAGLNFPGNASYHPKDNGKLNITPFELPLWLLGQFSSVAEALECLPQINLWQENFNKEYPLTPLHWLLSDRNECVVLEPMDDGLHIHRNPIGVLTNNPPFDYHLNNLANYLNLSPTLQKGVFQSKAGLDPISNGIGAVGLPGDYSSVSRFIRAAFVKVNSPQEKTERDQVGQFFHILSSVAMPKGSVVTTKGIERTVYSSCCNTDKGIYYYTTYTNSQITAVSLCNTDLCETELIQYPLGTDQQIRFIN